jgi:hypothetical protein
MIKKIIFLIGAIVFLYFVNLGTIIADENSTNNNSNIITNSATNADIKIIDFLPKEVYVGDIEFNINVKNNENYTINDIGAYVTGKGFSTYEIITIDYLLPNSTSYILVFGNLKESGNITLTVKIGNKEFHENIMVKNTTIQIDEEKQKLEEEAKKQKLFNLSIELEELKNKTNSLETELSIKKDNNYDISSINLNLLRGYIANIQTGILEKNVEKADISLKLADDEYDYQKSNLDNSKKIPTINKLKDYAIIFSTLAGAIITFFALSELLKRKGEAITTTVKKMPIKKGENREANINNS